MKIRPGVWLIASMTLGFGPFAAHAETYRWTDEKGDVHYSDQIPPDQVKNRRSKLSAQGFEVDVVEAPKTPEQQEREHLLKKLREQQEKVLNEQREQDRALVRTYRSVDEIITALKIKLDRFDQAIEIARTTSQRQVQLLSEKKKAAELLESSGQPIPQSTRDGLAAQQNRLDSYMRQQAKLENEKRATADHFERDIKRFKAILAMQGRSEGAQGDWTKSVVLAETNHRNDIVISAIDCQDDTLCEQYWNLTRDYIRKNSGYRIAVDTDRILQTPYPLNDTDFGITATRMAGDPKDIIFIDVLCRPTVTGEQLCRGGKVRELLIQFRPSLQQQAGGNPPPATPASKPRD